MEGEVSSLSIAFLLPRLAAVAALIAINGFFVAMEFALVGARRPRLETWAKNGNVRANLVLRMIDNIDLYIAAVQLGNTLASLALGWIGDITVAAILFPLLQQALGTWLGLTVAHAIGTSLSFILITFTHIVLGEQVPKIASIRSPESTAMLLAPPMQVFTLVFRPFIWALDRSTAMVLKLVGVQEPVRHHHAYNLEELKVLVEQSMEVGLIPKQDQEILSRVLEFSERLVREAMIPRPEIVGISEDATVEEFLHLFKEHRHARFPVYRGDLDHIVGIIAIKDVLALLAEDPDARHRRIKDLNIMQPVFAVPETRRIGDLFQEMRNKHIQMAIIIDEYGGTAGLVTLEELAEEILGRVTDEWVREEPDIRPIDEHTYDINAQLRVDEINEALHLNIPENDLYETVAGFILYELGHIPEEGEVLVWNGMRFQVLKMKGPKIERVMVTVKPGEKPLPEEDHDTGEARPVEEEVNLGETG